jgi:hypothetical protein
MVSCRLTAAGSPTNPTAPASSRSGCGYPAVGTAQWQVTTGGGTRPLWSPRGRELLYVAPGGEVMGVAVPSGSSWGSTTPTLLVKGGYSTNPLDPIRTYDVSADGQRFLLINWGEELERLAPLK